MDLYRWLLRKYIAPYLGKVALGQLSTPMVRQWRSDLLRDGVSVSVAAKAYRLLRSVLMTAVEDDKILSRNPCRIRGAGDEHAGEQPVLTIGQVLGLAELLGRRPLGNIRKLPGYGYRPRFAREGTRRTAPEVYASRPAAESALWSLMIDGRAEASHDRRYGALVLLATFASLRWGEVTALRRCDLDLTACTVRVRAAFVERSTGGLVLGPPKSDAGRRVVGFPPSIVPALRDHLAQFVGPEPALCCSQGSRVARYAAATSTSCRLAVRGACDRRGRAPRSRPSAQRKLPGSHQRGRTA